ncbi:hypothetical protein BGX30_015013 [Mortierella sp. GBA39]|nr:hypothetical protein BGX30_015013 [Mortierella sp. GBA39]
MIIIRLKTPRRPCVCGSAEHSGFMICQRDCDELGGGTSFNNNIININACTVKSQDKDGGVRGHDKKRKGGGNGDCDYDDNSRAKGYKKDDKGNGRGIDIRTQTYDNDGGTKIYHGINNRAKRGTKGYEMDGKGKGKGHDFDSRTKPYDNDSGAKV